MSHFSVLVTGDDVEAALEPFDENRETPRYLKRTRAQIVADGRKDIEAYRDTLYARFLADKEAYIKDCHNPAHLVYLFEEFPKRLAWTDDEVYADGIRWLSADELDEDGNEWSESNPQGYWDYWRVGGRWARHLVLNVGARGHSEPLSWEWNYDGPAPNDADTHADVAVKGDVDLDSTPATFAIVHDGQWISRGEMGWFGALRSEEVSEDEWPARWREVMDSLPDDLRLTVVDCHV